MVVGILMGRAGSKKLTFCAKPLPDRQANGYSRERIYE